MNREIDNQEIDNEFFRGYGDLGVHRLMLGDTTRTHTYKRAILTNYNHFRGKVVLDLGAGTGILSVFCAYAGAKKVYAVENSSIANAAEVVFKTNNVQDKIVLVRGKIEDIELPEKVDVIVSEWMGCLLLHENMLSSVIFARDKYLKEDGNLYPQSCKLYLAPFNDEELEKRSVGEQVKGFWPTVKSLYGVDMEPLVQLEKEQDRTSSGIIVGELINPSALLAKPANFAEIDVLAVTKESSKQIQGEFLFDCYGRLSLHGFCLWFSVDFPGNITLNTSPDSLPTHWLQGLLYVPPFQTEQGMIIKGSVTMIPHESREVTIKIEYSIDGGEKHQHQFSTANMM